MKGLFLMLILLPLFADAQLSVAKIFTSDMVLQRAKPVHIWGKAAPGSPVRVVFAGMERSAIAAIDSAWTIEFKKQPANPNPQEIKINSGQQTFVLKNILIGDVWVCSGQSNMEFPMAREAHFSTEKYGAKQPLIRLYNPSPAGRNVYAVAYTDSLNKRLTPERFYEGKWQTCDSASVKTMSAVAYYFAKSIVQKEHVPIGLVHLAIGGAPIETFISRETLQKSIQFAEKVKGNWLDNPSLPEWVRKWGWENIGKNSTGFGDEFGLNHAYKPGFAYECGIEPLLALPVKGVIWYQGESNSLEKERADEYPALQKLLVKNYRSGWKQPDMPFYWVQLSSIDTTNYQSRYWPEFRNNQRILLDEISHGGMAVCSDIGFKNNVHPTDKKTVGERLARWALNQDYGEKSIVKSGPLPVKAGYKNGRVEIRFRFADGLKAGNGKPLTGFSLDGKMDREAKINGANVLISSNKKPAFVYYGWKPYCNANLINAAGLPASTFKIPVH